LPIVLWPCLVQTVCLFEYNVRIHPEFVNDKFGDAVMAQITDGENVIQEESFFNPALCLQQKRCFQHDMGSSPPITEELQQHGVNRA